MKIGDLIRHRQAWIRDPHDDAAIPRTDDEGWSDPVLIVDQLPPPDDELYIGLDANGERIVVSQSPGLTDVKVISEG